MSVSSRPRGSLLVRERLDFLQFFRRAFLRLDEGRQRIRDDLQGDSRSDFDLRDAVVQKNGTKMTSITTMGRKPWSDEPGEGPAPVGPGADSGTPIAGAAAFGWTF